MEGSDSPGMEFFTETMHLHWIVALLVIVGES